MRKILIAVAAAAGLVVGAAPASATEHKEVIGGVYVTYMAFSQGNAQGSNGAVLPAIWMDRATSNNASSWDGRLGLRTNSNWTGSMRHENYWWRTCFDTQSHKTFCGSWFHP